MPDERLSDLRRFASDLRALREDRGVSLQRIQSDTRIPADVLAQFEETGLEGNRTFNRVYLRSLVRTYAETLGISADAAVQSLDAAFDNRYTGLAPDGPLPDPVPASAPDPVPAPVPEEVPAPVPEEASAPAAEAASEEDAETPAQAPRRVVAAASGYDPGPSGSVFDTVPDRPGLPSWAYGLLVLLALALVAGGVFWWMGRTPQQTVQGETLSPESLPSADTLAPPAPPVALPDTLRLTVRATGGKLSPFRVTVDQEPRRPYWLNAEEERTFAFRDSVTVTGLTPTATLRLGDQAVDPARLPGGSVRLRRADLQAGR